MSRVLVTGADGFTGRYVAPLLAKAGHEVIGMSRSAPDTPVPGLAELLAFDIADAEAMQRAVAVTKPDRVLHLAGIAFVGHGAPDAFYTVNILGTRALLAACTALDSPPEQIILASSAQVYGPAEGMLDEDHATLPGNDYAVSKLAMEHVARLYADRLPITITRPFNYSGVGQSRSFLIPKIIDHVRRRAPMIELGNLHVERDFSDVRTVAEIYTRLLDQPGATGTPGTLNICSGQAHRLDEILDIARALTGHAMEIRVNPAFVRPNEVVSQIGDRTRLDHAIGPVDRPPLEDMIRWMIDGS